MSLDDRYLVGPVRKALQLLDELAAAGRPLGLSEVAMRAAVPKTTAFRYLYTLRAAGFVKFDKDLDRYAMGDRIAVVASSPNYIDRLKDALQPTMRRLQRQFNETVNLGIREGAEIVYLDMVGSTRSLRMEAAISSRDPLHSTALGKAMLAALPENERATISLPRMTSRTPNTLVSRETLLTDLKIVAERGYALDMEENEMGARCVAAAIRSVGTVAPLAAISISGPLQRMSPEVLRKMGMALVRAVSNFSFSTAE